MKKMILVFTLMMCAAYESYLQASSTGSRETLSGALLANHSIGTTVTAAAAGAATPPPPPPLTASAAAARATPPVVAEFACVNIPPEDGGARAALLHARKYDGNSDTAARAWLLQRSSAENTNRHCTVSVSAEAAREELRIRYEDELYTKILRGFETLSTCARTCAGVLVVAYIIWPSYFSSHSSFSSELIRKVLTS